jgi:hypothetical protein
MSIYKWRAYEEIVSRCRVHTAQSIMDINVNIALEISGYNEFFLFQKKNP